MWEGKTAGKLGRVHVCMCVCAVPGSRARDDSGVHKPPPPCGKLLSAPPAPSAPPHTNRRVLQPWMIPSPHLAPG